MTSLDTSSEDLQTVVASENTDPVTVQQNHFINHKRFFLCFAVYNSGSKLCRQAGH